MASTYDAIIIGGGHNGLTYGDDLARAGLRTLVLERRPLEGGARVSSAAAWVRSGRQSPRRGVRMALKSELIPVSWRSKLSNEPMTIQIRRLVAQSVHCTGSPRLR